MPYSVFKNTGEKFTVSGKQMGETQLRLREERLQRVVRDISGSNNQQRVASSNFSRKWRWAAPDPTSFTYMAMIQPRRKAYPRMARLCMGNVC
jgi:hypothetical protein